MFSLGGGEDDELDFSAPSGSGLKNLFSGSKKLSGSRESLKFSAPKQPKQEPKKDGTNSGVLFASVCHTYLSVNNNFASRGKLGVAITGAKTIIIYGQKQRVVSSCQIKSDTKINITAANFASYYDDQQQCWGVMFEKDFSTFLEQFAVARFTADRSLSKQLLAFTPADKCSVSSTDNVTLSYRGWIFQNDKLSSTEFDSNDCFVARLAARTIIPGWVELLPGCLVTGEYLFSIPSCHGYGEKGAPPRIPPNSDLVFRVKIMETEHADLTDTSSVESFSTPAVVNNSNNNKQEILSRMARMGGQPAFPTINNQQESSPESDANRSRASSTATNKSSSRPRRKSRSDSQDNNSVHHHHQQQPVSQPVMSTPGPLVQNGFPFAPALTTTHQPIYQVAAAPASGELRETLDLTRSVSGTVSSVEDRLRGVERALETLSSQAVLFNTNIASCPNLDTQLLMMNIQRLVNENTALKSDVKCKTVDLESRSGKITELLNRNQELVKLRNEAVEQSQNNFMESSSQASEQIRKLEQENGDLRGEMAALRSSTQGRQYEVDMRDDQIRSLRGQMESVYGENNKLQQSLFEVRSELSSLKLSSSNSQESVLQAEMVKLKERNQLCLMEKLELSNQVEDLQFRERQIQLRSEKKISQLEEMLKEGGATALLENENALLRGRLSEVEGQIEGLRSEVKQEKENSARKERRAVEMESDLRETISGLNREIDNLSTDLVTSKSQCSVLHQKLEEEVLKQRPEPPAPAPASPDKSVIVGRVKQILNGVFRAFRDQIDLEEEYTGREVMSTAMDIIKTTTLRLIAEESSGEEESEGDSSSSDDDDDDGDGDGGGPVEVRGGHRASLNSTEFEIPESSADFLNVQTGEGVVLVGEEEGDQPRDVADESFYSAVSPGQPDSSPRQLDSSPRQPDSSHRQPDSSPRQPDSLPRPREPYSSPGQPIEQNDEDLGEDVAEVEPEIVIQDPQQQHISSEEFIAREEEDQWMAVPPPSEPPPSPRIPPVVVSPPSSQLGLEATFETGRDSISVEDIADLNPEVSSYLAVCLFVRLFVCLSVCAICLFVCVHTAHGSSVGFLPGLVNRMFRLSPSCRVSLGN
eukprot:sb/3479349/